MDSSKKYITEIDVDSQLVTALQQVLPIINANKTTFGLSAQQVTDLTTLSTTFTTQYNAAQSAKAAAKAAVTSKDVAKKAVRDSIVSYAKAWRANNTIPDSLLEQVQVAPHKTPPSSTAPVTPNKFLAATDGLGQVTLTWKANGNKSGTVYVIEYRTSATGDWETLGAETRGRFVYDGEPGKYISFRIYAQRSSKRSAPTAPITLWEGGSTIGLQIAA